MNRLSVWLVVGVMGGAVLPPVGAQGTPTRQVKAVDRIVAVVNTEAITGLELANKIQVVKANMQRSNVPLPSDAALRQQVLDRMIEDIALLQFARNNGVTVDDSQLDMALSRIAEQNNMTLPQFRAALQRDRVDYAKFREEIREEIIMTRLREREVESTLVVSEAEVDNFLKLNGDSLAKQAEYRLQHLVVGVPEQASPEAIQLKRQKVDKALADLARGVPFAQVAATYSEAPDALKGGDLGWRKATEIPDVVLDAVAKLPVNGLTPVLRSPAGFHVIKLLEKRDASAAVVVEQTRVRHILIKVSEGVPETDARNRALQVRERVANGAAKFEEMARLHSEDASAASGGDLGWVTPGDSLPEFERAVAALKPGQISEVVRTPFGFHVIQVLERRNQDVTGDRMRLNARQTLRNKKLGDAYLEFVQQVRGRAFVEIRSEDD